MQDLWSPSDNSGSFGAPSGVARGVYDVGPTKSPSPYLDFATMARPRTFADVIDWSEYVATMTDDMWSGLTKLYGYFATRVLLSDNSSEVRIADGANIARWDKLLNQTLKYPLEQIQLGLNVAVYGNDFVTVTMASRRLIQCPVCEWSTSISAIRGYGPEIDFGFSNMAFFARCQGRCKSQGKNPRRRMRILQYMESSAESIIITHWPFRELDFDFLEARNKMRVYWKIPQRIRDLVLRANDPDMLHDLDWAVLEAICANKMLEFDSRVMFHGKEPHLSGLNTRGLGLPRTLALSRQHWFVQLLKRQCQVLANSYLIPMEFFSLAQPNQMGLAGDPGMSVNIGELAGYMEHMINAHKKDPTRKFYIPYPVNFQVAGANANQFVPVALLELAERDLANNLVPQAMLRGELTIQTSPIFTRMFEATNRAIPYLYNSFLWFFVGRVSELMRMEPVWAIHEPVSVADNVNVDAMLMQSASMGTSSNAAWMSRVGLDSRWEKSRMLSEQKAALDMQRESQKLSEQYDFGDQIMGQASQETLAGGQPGQPAAGGEADGQAAQQMQTGIQLPSQGFRPTQNLNQMPEQAAAMASTLLMLPPQQRRAELSVLNQKDESFHSLVVAELEKQRTQAGSQARQTLYPTM